MSFDGVAVQLKKSDGTEVTIPVAKLHANESTKQLFRDARQRQVDQVRSARSKTNENREAYIQAIIDLRTAVDSGASLITLPQQVALRCGIRVGPEAPAIVLSLADGRKISGNLVTLESVRVGKFTAKDVECAVLGAEAVNASPLLGMSFLANFTFEVDASKGTLTMVQVK